MPAPDPAAKLPSPTVPPPQPGSMSTSLRRNIQALQERRRREAAAATRQERIAEAITAFTGSMRFVIVHLVLYGGWILANCGLIPGLPRFDPSFVTLAMVASVEAIFLSTFVLISQNRMAEAAEKRAELDLQINLLAEHELTNVARLLQAVAERLGVAAADNPELRDVVRDVAPEAVMDAIEAEQGEA